MSIKAEIFTTQFGQAEGLKVRAGWDPMINQALTYMPQAATLEQAAEKIDSQKTVTAKNTPASPATE
jgi:carboxyl-terminal processing protease